MTNIGDNTLAGDRLKSFIERIERLEEDKQGIAADIRELKAEARAEGFDQKMINEMLRLRKMHAPARATACKRTPHHDPAIASRHRPTTIKR